MPWIPTVADDFAPILSHLDRRIAELTAAHARSLAVVDLFRAARSAAERGDEASCTVILETLARLVWR